MNLENIMLSDFASHRNMHTVGFHGFEIHEIVKFAETEKCLLGSGR